MAGAAGAHRPGRGVRQRDEVVDEFLGLFQLAYSALRDDWLFSGREKLVVKDRVIVKVVKV